MGGGRVSQMRANACKGGGGILALSAHAFWTLKDLQFWDVLIGFDPIDHYKNNIGYNLFG